MVTGNNSNRVLLTELYNEVFTKQGIITAQLSQITRKFKQDNGKENEIIKFKQNNGNENEYTHIFRGYILPKDKRGMIFMTG